MGDRSSACAAASPHHAGCGRSAPYPGYFQRPACCRLRIYQHQGRTIALFTEFDDNPGASITNRAETVAHLAVREYELDPEHTTFIEHYPGRLHTGGGVRDETFDLVTFGELLPLPSAPLAAARCGPGERDARPALGARGLPHPGRPPVMDLEPKKDPPPGDEAALWADIERVWEALTDPSAMRFPVPDDLAPTDDVGERWRGTPLEEAVRLMEKVGDAQRLRERCQADLHRVEWQEQKFEVARRSLADERERLLSLLRKESVP